MTLQPTQHRLILTRLNLLRPEPVVVIVAAQARDANPNAVLRPADNPVTPFRIVLKAEHQFGQRLRVHIGQLVRPDLADHVAGAGAEAATLADLEGGLQADGDGPAGGVLGDVGLVNPRAGKVQARGNLALRLLEVGGAAGCEAFLRDALQDNVLDAMLLAEPALFVIAAIAIHHQNIGLEAFYRGDEVHDAAARVDERILHVADALHHEQALLLAIDGFVVLVFLDGLVRADAYV